MKAFEVVPDEARDAAVLKVRVRRLGLPMREEFLAATSELLARPEVKLIVDVSGLSRIFSLFIGALVDLNMRAQQAGKSLAVLTSPGVADQLRGMSLDQNMDIREGHPPGR